jgi:predicted AlkP superfamily pyrophosphatase or phosphodiesterase
MRKILLFTLLIIFSLTLAAQKKKALFIIVDGIPADVIEKLETPGLDSIAGSKGYKRAYVGGEKNGYSQTPTISAVGYNSVLTGTWANKHNVWGNYGKDIAAPNYHYKSIFRIAKDHDPKKKIGIFSSWLDNRTKLVGEDLAATGNIKMDYKYDSLEHDTITYPKDTTSLRMHHIDEAVVNKAAEVIKNEGPDLSWVYLEYTDDMGHTFGDGPQFFESIKTMDNQMIRLWQSIQYRKNKFNEDWLVMITTDHGRDSATGKNHGGQSDRERSGWIVTNAKDLNAHYVEDSISIVDIMPTIARFLGFKLSQDHKRETDGVSLIGKIAATDLKAVKENGKIKITWKKKVSSDRAKVWIATTNNFEKGGNDKYKLLGEVSLDHEKAEFKAPDSVEGFYKVVLETPYNTLNRWIVADKK